MECLDVVALLVKQLPVQIIQDMVMSMIGSWISILSSHPEENRKNRIVDILYTVMKTQRSLVIQNLMLRQDILEQIRKWDPKKAPPLPLTNQNPGALLLMQSAISAGAPPVTPFSPLSRTTSLPVFPNVANNSLKTLNSENTPTRNNTTNNITNNNNIDALGFPPPPPPLPLPPILEMESEGGRTRSQSLPEAPIIPPPLTDRDVSSLSASPPPPPPPSLFTVLSEPTLADKDGWSSLMGSIRQGKPLKATKSKSEPVPVPSPKEEDKKDKKLESILMNAMVKRRLALDLKKSTDEIDTKPNEEWE